MVFGGLGMNTQVNAVSDDSTVATVQVQSVSKTDSAASVNPAEGDLIQRFSGGVK